MSEFAHLPRSALIVELMAPIGGMAEASSPYRLSTVALPDEALVARRLAVAREVLCRDLEAQFTRTAPLDAPDKVREYLVMHYAHLPHEVFGVLYLDAQNRLIEAEVEMFRGTLSSTSVHPREVVKAALARNAAAVLLCHCHPSGSPQPSKADELLTVALRHALALVEVKVLDHFIVAGASKPVSFAELGLL